MITNDLSLYMKFQRQPRVIGTKCFYAPSNRLLIPPGIKAGDKVFIVDFPQSGDDVYITVSDIYFYDDCMELQNDDYGKRRKADYIAGIPKEKKIMVIWKDLAQ